MSLSLSKYEVPAAPVYCQEPRCPFLPGDFFARRQWFFEKAYFESSWNWDIPFRERFRFTDGLEQYLYFKGEDNCPLFHEENQSSHWWYKEQSHWFSHGQAPYVVPFVIFFRNWIDDKAAGEDGWSLERSGNPWMDDYLKNAPLP